MEYRMPSRALRISLPVRRAGKSPLFGRVAKWDGLNFNIQRAACPVSNHTTQPQYHIAGLNPGAMISRSPSPFPTSSRMPQAATKKAWATTQAFVSIELQALSFHLYLFSAAFFAFAKSPALIMFILSGVICFFITALIWSGVSAITFASKALSQFRSLLINR
jgi:hypothetical protein